MNHADEKTRRLREVLADPVLWGQRLLKNRDGSPRLYWPHQIEEMRAPDRYIAHLDGRDTGKSISISTQVLHFAFTNQGGQGLIAAPFQGQLDNIIEEIEYQLDECDDLSASVALNKAGQPKITRKPYYKLEFQNRAVLHFRPAGSYGDAFRSLHVERVWVDEGAWLTEKAWKALRQCLKAGGSMRVYSTPNGIRNTTYYRLTTGTQGWRVFRWPSMLNPAWNAEREQELLEFYGGRDTAGWQHEVLGEHGKPAYGAFNHEHLSSAIVEIPEYQQTSITGEEMAGLADESEMFDRLEMLLNLSTHTGTYWLGADTGYTNDPTELVVFREESDDAGRPVLTCVLRVHMEHVVYTQVTMVLALLDRHFSFSAIGLDNGGNGTAVVHELLTLDKYRNQDFEGRLQGFDFGGVTTINAGDREIKKRTKEYMTSVISGLLQRGQLKLPSDDADIFDQFSTQTYTINANFIVYSKGNDHIVDATRCAMLARNLCQEESGPGGNRSGIVMPVATEAVFV